MLVIFITSVATKKKRKEEKKGKMDKNSTTFPVQLYIYDLSKGMARQLSPIMLGER